jgi:hypothetical protein
MEFLWSWYRAKKYPPTKLAGGNIIKLFLFEAVFEANATVEDDVIFL